MGTSEVWPLLFPRCPQDLDITEIKGNWKCSSVLGGLWLRIQQSLSNFLPWNLGLSRKLGIKVGVAAGTSCISESKPMLLAMINFLRWTYGVSDYVGGGSANLVLKWMVKDGERKRIFLLKVGWLVRHTAESLESRKEAFPPSFLGNYIWQEIT